MNRLSMDLSELTLNPGCFDEETWLIEPPGMVTDENAETKTSQNNEEEDLDKWLEGAVKKVDFRTRSALSRRLEKKKQKREKKERLHGNTDKSLSKIEESGDKDEPWLTSSPSSSMHKNSNADLSFNESDTEDEEFYFEAEEQIRKSKELYYTPRGYDKTTANNNPPRRNVKVMGQRSVDHARKISSNNYEEPNGVKNTHMSELERKAKEQEQELRMELMNRRDRLFVSNGNDSRPNSASSSASSSVMNMLATSKSVDFRSSTRAGSSVSSSHSNDGSMNDLNRIIENRTPTLNSRLPLPRRPVIPGRTGIPLPTPKSSKTLSRRNNDSRCSDRAISLEVDDECF